MTQPISCAYSVTGSGPPLILVHGIGASRATWATALPLLEPHFTVIAYDLRGHGASPQPEGRFGLDALVADLEHVREQAGVEAAHIAGHSLGGMIGPAYARAFPDRVLSLGLLSTAAFRTEKDSANVKAVVAAMRERGIADVLGTLAHRWFTDGFIAEHPEVIEARMAQVIGTNPEVFLNVFDIYAETEMAPWLHEITARSLVLTGENDGGCPPRLNQLIAEAMPFATLRVLPGLKHSILLEGGAQTGACLRDFLLGLGD